MNLTVKIKGLEEARKLLSLDRLRTVIVRTQNKAMAQGMTATKRKIREIYTIKASRLSEAFKLKNANKENLDTKLTVKGRTAGLQHYAARQKVIMKGKRKYKGVTVQVRKDRPREIVKRGFMPGTFQHQGIYRREGKARIPIERRLGPDVVGMVNIVGKKELERVLIEKTQPVFNHEFQWEMSKRG